MENAVDALKMSGSVLLFVLALSVAILSFTNARKAIDTVLSYSDRETLTIENDERFYYVADNKNRNRYVGKETIIPALYRAYKENYKIVFDFGDDYYLFKQDGEEVKTIDLSKQRISNDNASRQFLNGIIYGEYENSDKSKYINQFGITPNENSLYNQLSEIEGKKKIKEELGTYYIEDLKTNDQDDSEKSKITEVNKTEKRVITYTVE